MEIKITNIYSNEGSKTNNLIGDHGQSFLITTDKETILMDTGTSSDILLHNMDQLGILPTEISKIFFSHGHYDHSRALPGLLDNIKVNESIPVFGHPNILEKKVGKMAFIKKDLGFPTLKEDQKKKIDFQLNKDSLELATGVTTTGEIADRPHRDGTEQAALHEESGKFVSDPVIDDQSLIIDTKDGLIILTGCCHAGLLNTLEHVTKMKKKPIKAIIGGTHMVRFSKKEVNEVAEKLKEDYGSPVLYLNHCTDHLPKPLTYVVKKTPATKFLREIFGSELVKSCPVGFSIVFEI